MDPTNLPLQAVYTVDEVAKLLRINKYTAYRFVRDGTLPAVRLGKRLILVPRSSLERLLGGQIDEDGISPEREQAARRA